jgi:hypothetical protein
VQILIPERDLEAAAAEAERLASAIADHGGSLDPVFQGLDRTVADLEDRGIDPEELLPADAEPGLGLSLRQKRDGKTLWQSIVYAGRESLCNPDSKLRKKLSEGASAAGAGSLITAILAALGLPLVAIPIVTAIAAVVLAVGWKGFCNWIKAPPDVESG